MKREFEKHQKLLAEMREKLRKTEYLKYTLNSLVYWDKITYMPAKGIEYRSQVMGFLAEELYKQLSDKNLERYITYFDGNPLNDSRTENMIRHLKRNNSYVTDIPEVEYGQYMSLIANAEQVWERAKEVADYGMFCPYLEKIIAHFKRFATYWGYEDNPYDAVMSYYEDGSTVRQMDEMAMGLKAVTIELLSKIKNCEQEVQVVEPLNISKEKQKELSGWILRTIGFDFDRGRIDEGAHPTTLANSPDDVRIVTSYNENNVMTGVFNTLHEGGKGLYEQSIDKDLLGSLLAEVSSFGMEEAMGRFYENIIGKSKAFAFLMCDKLEELEPALGELDKEMFYRSINKATPSLIRIDADELTYTMHIIIRYELEKELINGEISVQELPDRWNCKYREYLGIEPQNCKDGVLQDIHWAAGYIGFFPSYFLANIIATQIAAMIEKELGPIEQLIEKGDFGKIHTWLSEKIYSKGALYSVAELAESVMGGELSSKYYVEYLKKKYGEVYNLQ